VLRTVRGTGRTLVAAAGRPAGGIPGLAVLL